MKGEGNQYDYGFRIYDPRIGKFLSTDPLTNKFAFYSPYQFAGNKPIVAIDIDGKEDHIYTISFFDKQGKAVFNATRNEGNVVGFDKKGYEVYENPERFVAEYNYAFSDGETYSLKVHYGSYKDMLNVKQSDFYQEASQLAILKGIQISDENWDKATFILGVAKGALKFAGKKILMAAFESGATSGGKNLVKSAEKQVAEKAEKVVAQSITNEAAKKVTSIVKKDEKLYKLAEKTFEGAAELRKEANGLLDQLAKGNLSPGIGTKNVFGNVFESRSKNGARVYFRTIGESGIEILGYSNKNNQQKVIDRLKSIY